MNKKTILVILLSLSLFSQRVTGLERIITGMIPYAVGFSTAGYLVGMFIYKGKAEETAQKKMVRYMQTNHQFLVHDIINSQGLVLDSWALEFRFAPESCKNSKSDFRALKSNKRCLALSTAQSTSTMPWSFPRPWWAWWLT